MEGNGDSQNITHTQEILLPFYIRRGPNVSVDNYLTVPIFSNFFDFFVVRVETIV